MPIRVFVYALRPPTRNRDLVTKQLLLAHRYQHTLTTIERARRRAFVAARRRIVGDLAVAEQVYETATAWLEAGRGYIAQQHVERHSRKTTAEERSRIAQLKAALKTCSDKVKALKQLAKESEPLKLEASLIDERADQLNKAARATCGVYWGTYLLIERAAQQARRSKTDPAYRPRVRRGYLFADQPVGDGQLGVQLQKGLACAGIMGSDTRVRVDYLPPEQWNTRPGRRKARTKLHMRIGSNTDKTPVWATFPMKMHRPLPREGIVKEVKVTRFVRGTQVEWKAIFTVEEPEVTPSPNHRYVAVHFGWRALEEGLRVAIHGDPYSKAVQTLLLDDGVLWLSNKERELRSLNDRLFNTARAYLKAWIGTNPVVPEGFAKQTRYLDKWRSPFKLVRFVEHWIRNRFPGDERIVALMTYWRHRWRHLYQWEVGCGRRLRARRTEQYRIFAAKLCEAYGTIIVDDTDYSSLARRKPVEEVDKENSETARRNRQLAASGEFRTIVENAARARGVKFHVAKARDITRSCHHCSNTCEFDQLQRRHQCEHCGKVWDQDYNAVANLIKRYEKEETSDPKQGATVTSGRFTKDKVKKAG